MIWRRRTPEQYAVEIVLPKAKRQRKSIDEVYSLVTSRSMNSNLLLSLQMVLNEPISETGAISWKEPMKRTAFL